MFKKMKQKNSFFVKNPAKFVQFSAKHKKSGIFPEIIQKTFFIFVASFEKFPNDMNQ
jgi:hypothetical protein